MTFSTLIISLSGKKLFFLFFFCLWIELLHLFFSRAPPKAIERPRDPAFNAINVDSEYDSDSFEAPPPPPSLPSFSHGSVPSRREALQRELLLTGQYPLFKVEMSSVFV